MKSTLHRAQLQLARLQWLHEDVFVQSGRHLNQMGMQNRSTIMSEMRKVGDLEAKSIFKPNMCINQY